SKVKPISLIREQQPPIGGIAALFDEQCCESAVFLRRHGQYSVKCCESAVFFCGMRCFQLTSHEIAALLQQFAKNSVELVEITAFFRLLKKSNNLTRHRGNVV